MMLTNEERLAYVTLALTPGIGPTRIANLKAVFGTWTGALAAPFEFLGTVPEMNKATARAVVAADPIAVARMLEGMAGRGEFVLTPFDPGFPAVLRLEQDPPLVVFGVGRRECLDPPAVAIVGSRHPTAYGIEATKEVARVAAQAGLVVVSGMARGLDAVAHWAAINAGGRTIGVLGNGIGVIYPVSNRALYRRVVDEGLLLTEHPPGERPTAGSFQRRNRMISALARATVVVEAARNSGALITANAAGEQGREVFGVPGPITSRTSEGVNLLIRDGALVYLEPDDLLARFPEVGKEVRAMFSAGDPVRSDLRDDLRRVWDALDRVPRMADHLAVELDLPISALLQRISELEILGLVEHGPSGYRRAE